MTRWKEWKWNFAEKEMFRIDFGIVCVVLFNSLRPRPHMFAFAIHVFRWLWISVGRFWLRLVMGFSRAWEIIHKANQRRWLASNTKCSWDSFRDNLSIILRNIFRFLIAVIFRRDVSYTHGQLHVPCVKPARPTHTHALFHFDRTTVHRETLKSGENVLHVHWKT